MNDISQRIKEYMEISNEPILISNREFKNTGLDVVIDAKISIDELNDKFIDGKYVVPNWYNDLVSKASIRKTILVISNINSISEIEQSKFIDIIKYKKNGTHKFPDNILILVTYNTENEYKLNESIASLVIHM